MKKLLTMISAAFAVHAAFGGDYPYSSAALTNVTVTGGFWLPRFETNRLVTLKADFEKCELERIPNFRRAGMVACLHAAAYRVASRKVREVRKVISSGSRASFPHFHIFIIPYFHNLSAVALAKVDSTISHFSWARVRPCP